MNIVDKIYVNGEFVPANGPAFDARDSASETIVARVHHASEEQAVDAVRAANNAARSWGETEVGERAQFVRDLADAIDARAADFERVAGQDVGTVLGDLPWHSTGTTRVLRTAADLSSQLRFDDVVGTAKLIQKPVGTVASLTPWNVPLMMINCKIAPALLTGNTVVLKHSEVAPQAGALFAEVIDSIGLPPGVVNVITGGPSVGTTLVEDPGVDMVAFTGSTATGKTIMASAAKTMKKVLFELGGKSAHLVLDDANLEAAVRAAVASTFRNNGQLCLATARLLVPDHLNDQALSIAVEMAESYVVGDPRDSNVTLGPLATGAHRDRVQAMIRDGVATGAKLATGGADAPTGLDRGYYVRPTVVHDVPRDNVLAQEEVFGPVLTVMSYSSEDDAIELANNTIYGLWGAVWSEDVNRANRIASRIRSGGVEINDSAWDPQVPTGGVGQSGFSREGGVAGMSEYLLSQALFQPASQPSDFERGSHT